MGDDREFKLDLPEEQESKPTLRPTHSIPRKKAKLTLDSAHVHKRRSRSEYVEREEVKESFHEKFGAKTAQKVQRALFIFVLLVFAYYLVPIISEIITHE